MQVGAGGGGGSGSDDDIGIDGDRLSNLPESIIHHIFSFTETIDVVRMSAVSRKWRYFWLSVPYLNFDCKTVFSTQDMKKHKNFIDWVLMSRNRTCDIQKFRLWGLDLLGDGTFYRWMDVIRGENLQELDLRFYLIERPGSEESDGINLLHCILNCGSLVSLKIDIDECFFKGLTFPDFRRLKTLELRRVRFENSEALLGNLVSSCPVLENLTIEECFVSSYPVHFENLIFMRGDECYGRLIEIFEITSLSLKNLKLNLRLWADYQLKLACPNLVTLTLSNLGPEDLWFEEMNCLQNLFMDLLPRIPDGQFVNMFKRICNVKTLNVSHFFLKYLHEAVQNSELFSPSFNNLKSLTLILRDPTRYYGEVTINILDQSPNLETLTISYAFDFERPAWVQSEDSIEDWNISNRTISCLKYHLKTVELINIIGDKYELEMVRFFLTNGHVLQKISISWKTYLGETISGYTEKMISEVMKFPRSSPNVALTFNKATT